MRRALARLVLGLMLALGTALLSVTLGPSVHSARATSPSMRPRLVRSAYVPGQVVLVLPHGDLLGTGAMRKGSGFYTGLYKLGPSGSSIKPLWTLPSSCLAIQQTVLGAGGRIYVTGLTGPCLRTTPDAFQRRFGGGENDGFIVELSLRGRVLYASYLGGSRGDEGYALAVDHNGRVYVAGMSCSADFPLEHAFQSRTRSGCTGFLAKFRDGSKLVYSTFFGGRKPIDAPAAVADDPRGNTYVAGSAGSSDFPTTKHAFEPKHPHTCYASGFCSETDGFVAKLGPRGRLVWSTYLGGRGGASAVCPQCIAVHAGGQVTVAGATLSHHFPIRRASQAHYGGTTGGDPHGVAAPEGFAGDCFVTTLKRSGRSLVASTYLGGGGDDGPFAMAMDRAGHIYVAGGTASYDFPVHLAIQKHYGGDSDNSSDEASGGGDAFVAELRRRGGLLYSTYLGGSGGDWATNILLHHKVAYVGGLTDSPNFPLVAPRSSSRHGGVFLARIAWR